MWTLQGPGSESQTEGGGRCPTQRTLVPMGPTQEAGSPKSQDSERVGLAGDAIEDPGNWAAGPDGGDGLGQVQTPAARLLPRPSCAPPPPARRARVSAGPPRRMTLLSHHVAFSSLPLASSDSTETPPQPGLPPCPLVPRFPSRLAPGAWARCSLPSRERRLLCAGARSGSLVARQERWAQTPQEQEQAGPASCSPGSLHTSPGPGVLTASVGQQQLLGSGRPPHRGLSPSFWLWWPFRPWGLPHVSLPAETQALFGCLDQGDAGPCGASGAPV